MMNENCNCTVLYYCTSHLLYCTVYPHQSLQIDKHIDLIFTQVILSINTPHSSS